jgi:hypothetical protein
MSGTTNSDVIVSDRPPISCYFPIAEPSHKTPKLPPVCLLDLVPFLLTSWQQICGDARIVLRVAGLCQVLGERPVMMRNVNHNILTTPCHRHSQKHNRPSRKASAGRP